MPAPELRLRPRADGDAIWCGACIAYGPKAASHVLVGPTLTLACCPSCVNTLALDVRDWMSAMLASR